METGGRPVLKLLPRIHSARVVVRSDAAFDGSGDAHTYSLPELAYSLTHILTD